MSAGSEATRYDDGRRKTPPMRSGAIEKGGDLLGGDGAVNFCLKVSSIWVGKV